MGAAKFREETPRKGGGFATKDRNTALQQYAEVTDCLQVQTPFWPASFLSVILIIFKDKCLFFPQLLPQNGLVRRNKMHGSHVQDEPVRIHAFVMAPKQKIRAKQLLPRQE